MERNSCGPTFEISPISDDVNDTFDSHISSYIRYTPEPQDFNYCTKQTKLSSLLRSSTRFSSTGSDSITRYRRQSTDSTYENLERPSTSSTRSGTQRYLNFSNLQQRESSRSSLKEPGLRCSSVNSMRTKDSQSVSPSRMTLILDKVGRHDVTCLSRRSQQQLRKRCEGSKPVHNSFSTLHSKENVKIRAERRTERDPERPKILTLNNYSLIYKVKKGTYDPLIHSKENILIPDEDLSTSVEKTPDVSCITSQREITQRIQQKMRTLEERNQRGRKPPCPVRAHYSTKSDPDPVPSSPFQKKELDERYARLTGLLDSISQQITDSLNKSSVM